MASPHATFAPSDTGAAVFGQDDGSVSIATVGRVIFSTVLQASDYLQSVSDETRSSQFRKADVTPAGK